MKNTDQIYSSSFSNISYFFQLVAIIGVISIHVFSPNIGLYGEIDNFLWWVSCIIDSSFRWTVPIFIMFSGSWLLNNYKEESMKLFLRRRISRIGIPLMGWSIVYFFWINFAENPISIKEHLIKTIIFGRPYYHLYCLYIMFGLYMILPILNVLLRYLNKSKIIYLLLFIFITSMFSNMTDMWYRNFWYFDSLTSFSFFLPYIGYFIAGYIFTKINLNKTHLIVLFIGFILSIIVTIIGNWFLVNNFGNTPKGLILRDYLSPTAVVMSLSLFLLIIRAKLNKHMWITIGGKTVFGIYLVHPIVLSLLNTYYFVYQPTTLLFLIAKVVFIYTISLCIVVLISYIPIVQFLSGIPKTTSSSSMIIK